MSLALLDFKVTISKDGNNSLEFHKKPAKKPLFVHHQSAILTKSKLSFIRKERKRIEDTCSSHIFATQHFNTFDDILRLNGYPENSIEQTKRPQNYAPNETLNLPTEWPYLKIPYISERLSHRITNIFRKENIPVGIAHKSYTLRQALSQTFSKSKYTRDKCPGLCLRRSPTFLSGLKSLSNACHARRLPKFRPVRPGKSGPPQKVDQFFRNVSGWTEPIH